MAVLYGVSTKVLNQAVKRNLDRFPPDFLFRLTPREKAEVVTNCDHLSRLKYSPQLPSAFTEHGALMVANLLNSPAAIAAGIQVVRTFVRLRELALSHEALARRIVDMEKHYDHQFQEVFRAIRRLMEPPFLPPIKKIGF